MPLSRYAVMGEPVGHSLSPQIHQIFAAQFGIELSYDKIPVPLGHLRAALADFRAQGGQGLNITAPLKEEAYQLCQPQGPAVLAHAVNTMYWDASDRLLGTNTDGLGLCQDILVNLGWPVADQKILICGAGGAAAGIIEPLLSHHPASITVTNRDMKRVNKLIERFGSKALSGCVYSELENDFDIIINATSASLTDVLLPLKSACVYGVKCYDLSYSEKMTAFCQFAKTHRAQIVVDGLGMLIEQAALSFEIWHGVKPVTQGVKALLAV
jgi:shikimate dehydrogenase